MLRRLAVAAVLPLALLAGCAAETADAPTQTPEPTVQSVEPSESAPATELAEPSPTTESVEPTPTPTLPPTTEPTLEETEDAPVEDDDIDLVDGVRTNRFGAMPKELEGGYAQRSLETNPQEHRAVMEYVGESSSVQFLAYYPTTQGEYAPVAGTSDEGYTVAVESAVEWLGKNGPVQERSVDAGGLAWDCVEGQRAQQDGEVDHTLCVTTSYGRVIEVQRLSLHEPDVAAWQAEMDAVLEELGAGVVALAE